MNDFVNTLPAVNATLNGIATLLLTVGFILIKRGRKQGHGIAMFSAFCVSVIFLITYVVHKILVDWQHTPFGGEGFWRLFYFILLISHIILAMAIVPLVLRTLYLAARKRFEAHRRWARWTFPLWYYVSITGILVYFFLYQWFQPTPTAY